jgi:D-glycero-D-manno-heptose 1,7-bisphosphate phosphatase
MELRRAVFLDRDGVINRCKFIDGRPFPPAGLLELEILPQVPAAIESLRRAGFLTVVVTNQPDVGAGKQERIVVEAIHGYLRSCLAFDDLFVCYHSDADRCDCRKPKPGMLLAAAAKWSIDLGQSFMVGDRWRDVDAGREAGCRTFWIRDPANRERAADNADWIVSSLFEASRIICQSEVARSN